MNSKNIVLKLSGEILSNADNARDQLDDFAQQLIKLQKKSCHVSIVIGGGNFFRGDQHGAHLNLSPSRSHEIGMVATVMNGLILQDILSTHNLATEVMSAFSCDQFATPISAQRINDARKNNAIIIFVGGTGNPFVTTDTAAVIRALQVNAHELWKATKVDGVYDRDPHKYSDAQFIPTLSYHDAISQNIDVMDHTALTLAQKHSLTIKVFNMSARNALIRADEEKEFGSTIK